MKEVRCVVQECVFYSRLCLSSKGLLSLCNDWKLDLCQACSFVAWCGATTAQRDGIISQPWVFSRARAHVVLRHHVSTLMHVLMELSLALKAISVDWTVSVLDVSVRIYSLLPKALSLSLSSILNVFMRVEAPARLSMLSAEYAEDIEISFHEVRDKS